MGCGVVGSGVVKVILENGEHIAQRLGRPIVIKKVLELQPDRVIAAGLEASVVTDNYLELVNDPEIEIVVELMGGIEPARTFVLEALRQGKHVVTANKDLIALHGRELLETAQEKGRDFYFEASVGGGIPIISPLKQSLAANQVQEVMGIVNGTTNYILTKMAREGLPYQEVLQEAQSLGYAEADPTSDVEGYDAARKIAILASIAFGTRITFPDVYVEGITRISPLDLAYGKELGYALKLLAIAKEENGEIDVRVHPAFIPVNHPLASVNDVFNAVFVRGDFVGEVMHYGRGAGQRPTASAVVGDIMEVARNAQTGSSGRISCTCFEQKRVKPISEIMSRYYIRMMLKDRPGVLASIAGVFGNQEVSLASVLQKRTEGDMAELVFVTHQVQEGNLQDALKIIGGLSIVGSINNVVRVEGETD
ncbi:MAG: homoserine dehydrogenase [Syntrophomonadaceae bacterium]|nr:homoserine dehydrogenase [Syntrophomonadaceae bacterium]